MTSLCKISLRSASCVRRGNGERIGSKELRCFDVERVERVSSKVLSFETYEVQIPQRCPSFSIPFLCANPQQLFNLAHPFLRLFLVQPTRTRTRTFQPLPPFPRIPLFPPTLTRPTTKLSNYDTLGIFSEPLECVLQSDQYSPN